LGRRFSLPHSLAGSLKFAVNEENNRSSGSASQESPEEITRRRFFEKVSLALGGLCAAILGVPLVGFVIAPLHRKAPNEWLPLGKVDDFGIGKTVNVTITDPSSLPWAGVTSMSAVWLRRVSEEIFIAFSVHCSHLGCPVRWQAGSKLFMCPCHGGVFYADGTVASGPPPAPLVRHQVKMVNGQVFLKAAPIPITTTL
jgi:menaquinol-cytochrome c reductase iron-sulfur subunit